MRKYRHLLLLLILLSGSAVPVVQAGLADYLESLKGALGGSQQDATAIDAPAPGTDEIVTALKQALQQGTGHAVETLGREGGFLDNARVRIPMPDSLAWIEKTLRTLHQDRLADEFVASMNMAAERAVPEAAMIFGDAIRAMTLADASAILNGPDDAATRYFREHTEAALTDRMRPVVEQATAAAGVTAAYKNMTARAGGLGGLLSEDATDIDGYVTRKTLDGLFLMVADEEKRIRENPLARSTDLLKKVFGSTSG